MSELKQETIVITPHDLPLHCAGPQTKPGTATHACFCRSNPTAASNALIAAQFTGSKAKPAIIKPEDARMKRTAPLLLIFALGRLRLAKAVRPTAPSRVVAETQTYTIDYKAAKGSERIKAACQQQPPDYRRAASRRHCGNPHPSAIVGQRRRICQP